MFFPIIIQGNLKAVSLQQMKSLVVIFVVLVIGIIFIVIWEFSSKPSLNSSNYNEISWRLPKDKEIKKMGDTFLQSNIDLCANFFIKKFEGEKYLIACDSGNGAWTYYTAYAGQRKVYHTPAEFTSTLIPPKIKTRVDHPAVDLLKQETNIAGKTKSSPERNLAK